MEKIIRAAIRENFPQYANFLTDENSLEIFDLPNPACRIGGLIVQLHEEDIWFRGYPPHSGGCADSVEELIDIMLKILNDEMIIAVGYMGERWEETTLNFSNQRLVLEENLNYKVFSWSGELDEDIKATTL